MVSHEGIGGQTTFLYGFKWAYTSFKIYVRLYGYCLYKTRLQRDKKSSLNHNTAMTSHGTRARLSTTIITAVHHTSDGLFIIIEQRKNSWFDSLKPVILTSFDVGFKVRFSDISRSSSFVHCLEHRFIPIFWLIHCLNHTICHKSKYQMPKCHNSNWSSMTWIWAPSYWPYTRGTYRTKGKR